MEITKEHFKSVMKITLMQRNQDAFSVAQDYQAYLDVLISIVNTIAEEKIQIPIYKKKIETLIFRYTITAKTCLALLEGTKLDSTHFEKGSTVIDIPALYMLTRSLMENYLTIFYLFIQENNNEKIIEYRNLIYEISTLHHRQSFQLQSIPIPLAIERKMAEEAKVIKVMEKAIKANIEFQKLDHKIQKKVLNSPAHRKPSMLLSWKILFEQSKLNNDKFHHLWRIYSNYAHSEYLSVMQTEDALKNPQRVQFYIYQLLQVQVPLLCRLIIEFTELFPVTKKKYDSLDIKIKAEIEVWDMMATGENLPE